MFSNSLTQSQERDPRFITQQLPQERSRPDGSRNVGWLQRLKWKWIENRVDQAAGPELFVPDGRLALLILDGKPEGWFQPGRHQLDPAKIRMEVRLLPSDLLRDQHGDRFDPVVALDLPYERALLYVDGVPVAIVKPGSQVAGPLREGLDLPRTEFPAPGKERSMVPLALLEGGDELVQAFSHV